VILPNFLHIGYSKAASTWLQRLLKLQENIFFVYKTNYFFPLESINYKKGIDWYSSKFKGADGYPVIIESQEHIILPGIHPVLKCATTNIDSVKKIGDKIKLNLPKIKIILIIRNQVDMLISRYSQFILQGGTLSASDFLNALVFDTDNYKLYADYRYAKIISLLYDIFGRQNVLVLFQEELKRNPARFIETLSDFFNVNIVYNPEKISRKNIAPSRFGLKIIKKLNHLLVKEIETIESKTKTIGPWILWAGLIKIVRSCDRILIKNRNKREFISELELQSIINVYSDDNRKLGKLVSKPVSEYGYN
jgi:hypothetical protein